MCCCVRYITYLLYWNLYGILCSPDIFLTTTEPRRKSFTSCGTYYKRVHIFNYHYSRIFFWKYAYICVHKVKTILRWWSWLLLRWLNFLIWGLFLTCQCGIKTNEYAHRALNMRALFCEVHADRHAEIFHTLPLRIFFLIYILIYR